MRIYLFIFIIGSIVFTSCVNKDLDKIELRADLEGSFMMLEPDGDSVFTQDIAVIDTNSFDAKLDLANLNVSNIDKVSANAVSLTLTNPSDSTFEIFKSMTLSLKNNTDSIAFAEIGDFTILTSNNVSLRTLDTDVKSMLLGDTFWVEMAYTIRADTLPDTMNVDMATEWLIEGKF